MLYIHYLVLFSEELVEAFIDSKSEINTIKPSLMQKLILYIWKIKVGVEKLMVPGLRFLRW